MHRLGGPRLRRRARGLQPAAPCSGARGRRSDQRTQRRLAPRSANGTSIVSKSRGASVARNRARLVAQLAAGVAAREVREREQPHLARRARARPPGGRCCGTSDGRARPPRRRTSPRARAGRPRAPRSRAPRRARCRPRARSCALRASAPAPARALTPSTVSPRCRRPKSGPGLHAEPLGQLRRRDAPAASSSTSA